MINENEKNPEAMLKEFYTKASLIAFIYGLCTNRVFWEGSRSEGIPLIGNHIKKDSNDPYLWEKIQAIVDKGKGVRLAYDRRAIDFYNLLSKYSLANLEGDSAENLLCELIASYPTTYIIPELTEESVNTMLEEACMGGGDIHFVKYLKQDARIFGNEYILLACKNGHLEIVRELICDYHMGFTDYQSALVEALKNNQLAVAEWLINFAKDKDRPLSLQDKNYESLFLHACQNGNLEMLKLLLANLFMFPGGLEAAAGNGHAEILSLLLDNCKETPLCEEVIDYYVYMPLNHWSDEGSRKEAALWNAVQNGHAECVEILFEALPDCEKISSFVSVAGCTGVLLPLPLLTENDFTNLSTNSRTITELCIYYKDAFELLFQCETFYKFLSMPAQVSNVIYSLFSSGCNILKRLLESSEVCIPPLEHDRLFSRACASKSLEMVEILSTDPRGVKAVADGVGVNDAINTMMKKIRPLTDWCDGTRTDPALLEGYIQIWKRRFISTEYAPKLALFKQGFFEENSSLHNIPIDLYTVISNDYHNVCNKNFVSLDTEFSSSIKQSTGT